MARDAVKISKNLDDNALANAIFTQISDGTDALAINADGSLNATINNASIAVTATDLDIRDLTHVSDSVKVGDGTDLLAVNADGSINVTINNASIAVTATDLDIRNLSASQDNIAISDGTDTLAVNADGSINSVVTATDLDIRDLSSVTDSVTVVATDLDIRDLSSATDSIAVTDGGGSITVDGSVTVSATDLDIRDISHTTDSIKVGDGTDLLAVNADGSINVVVGGSSGTAIVDTDESSLASAASDNHDYTASGGAFKPYKVQVSGESIATFEILTGPSGTLVSRGKVRTSVEHPNAEFEFPEGFSIADTQIVRVTRTNDSNKTHVVNSTIIGSQL